MSQAARLCPARAVVVTLESGGRHLFGGAMRKPRDDMKPGSVFGRLTVESAIGYGFVACVCSCGTRKVVLGSSLRLGRTKSCGCLLAECARERGRSRATHGMTNDPTYRSWRAMKSRCLNKNATGHQRYASMGITITPRWVSFDAFLEDMGPRPLGYTLDRIDNSRGYCKENCRWATKFEQNNNTRANVVVEHDGKAMTVAQWARTIGIKEITLRKRLQKKHWSVADCLSRPVK